MSMRFTMESVVKRRLLHGDLPTIREDGRLFVPYDSVVARRAPDNTVELLLLHRKCIIASADLSFDRLASGDLMAIDRLEGRMEIKITGAGDKARVGMNEWWR